MDYNKLDNLLQSALSPKIDVPAELNDLILEKAGRKHEKRIIYPRMMKFAAAVCVVIMLVACGSVGKEAYGAFMKWIDERNNNDIGALQNDYIQTGELGEYTMRINRLVFSEHELYIGFAIDTDAIDYEDIIRFRIKQGSTVISDKAGKNKLFSECMSRDGMNSNMCIGNFTKNDSVTEGYAKWNGIGLNYMGQTVELECEYYDKDNNTIDICSFEILLDEKYMYKEKTASLLFDCERNGITCSFDMVINTFSGIAVTGKCSDVPDLYCEITDSSGNRLEWTLLSGYGDDRFVYFFRRNSIKECEEYKITISEADNLNNILYCESFTL